MRLTCVDGNTPARNPAGALHLPDTGGPSSPTSPPVRPRCSTNDYVQSAAPACNPQRPGTPAGAGRAYSSRWRRGPGLSYRLGRARHTLASPSTAVRWQTAAPGQQTQIKKKPRSDRRTAGVTTQGIGYVFQTIMTVSMDSYQLRRCELAASWGTTKAALTRRRS